MRRKTKNKQTNKTPKLNASEEIRNLLYKTYFLNLKIYVIYTAC